MSIEQNIRDVELRISRACERAGRRLDEVTLVAVTKNVDVSTIEEAFNAGIRNFGESRVQEAKPKIEQLYHLRSQITWHMVGHLQSNKAETATNIFDIIHSVDSMKLAESISKHTQKQMPVLIEVNISGEETKGGFPLSETREAVGYIRNLPAIEVQGLMTIAPRAGDVEEIRHVFSQLRHLRDKLGLKHLSIGMTDDFEVAIEEGATLVRIGRAIFGENKHMRRKE